MSQFFVYTILFIGTSTEQVRLYSTHTSLEMAKQTAEAACGAHQEQQFNELQFDEPYENLWRMSGKNPELWRMDTGWVIVKSPVID